MAPQLPAKDNPEECPVCHVTTYQRKDTQFFFHKECYHRLCNACRDRIFSTGSRVPCPIPGCRVMVRFNDYKPMEFEDTQMEREVAIRKYMHGVFNKRETDFEDLLAYNDYLNDVEDMTCNLIYNILVDETKQRIAKWQETNKDQIIQNKKLEMMNTEFEKQHLINEQKRSDRLRMAAFQEAQQHKRAREQIRQDLISRLAAEGNTDPEAIARLADEALLEEEAERQRDSAAGTASRGSGAGVGTDTIDAFTIKGLKQQMRGQPNAPFNPFGDISQVKDFVVIPTQRDLWPDYLGKLRKENIYKAGGYSVDDFYMRALTETFGGLGVSVMQEKKALAQMKGNMMKKRRKKAKTVDTDVQMTDVF